MIHSIIPNVSFFILFIVNHSVLHLKLFAIPVLCMCKKIFWNIKSALIIKYFSEAQCSTESKSLKLSLSASAFQGMGGASTNLCVCAYVHMQTTKLHSITWQFYAKEETVKDLVNRAAGVCEKESMGINQRDLFWNPIYHIRKKYHASVNHNYDVKRRNHDQNIYDINWDMLNNYEIKSQHCEVIVMIYKVEIFRY